MQSYNPFSWFASDKQNEEDGGVFTFVGVRSLFFLFFSLFFFHLIYTFAEQYLFFLFV